MKEFVLAASAVLLAVSSAAAAPAGTQIAYADSKALGAGNAKTFALTEGGKLQTLGVRIDASALRELGDRQSETALALPKFAGVPFQTIVIDWNPHGHPPAHVYDVPHFDVHMYAIDEPSRMKIAPGAAVKPPAELVPAGFITDGEVVPMMGLHYVDSSAAEFHGKPFSLTPIYGYDAGRLIFVEAMLTKAYLESKPDVTRALPQPASVQAHGLYPTSYQVRYDKAADTYVVSFSNFRSR